jgi:hypothetical protein
VVSSISATSRATSSERRNAPAKGDARMRYVFVDEAGTSANEPYRVVAGIIVHADTQCEPVDAAVAKIVEAIPEKVRERYPVFHAKRIWGDQQFREEWTLPERKALLEAMMSVPREMKLALAYGAEHKDEPVPPELLKRMRLVQAHHALAFQACIAQADRWIREYAPSGEIATVIAEDVPETRELLKYVAQHLKVKGGFVHPVQKMVSTDNANRDRRGDSE